MKRLENKVAVVYGDGNIGSAIAKAFAREGAKDRRYDHRLKKTQCI